MTWHRIAFTARRLITLTLNTMMFPVFPQNRIPAFPQVFPDLHFELL